MRTTSILKNIPASARAFAQRFVPRYARNFARAPLRAVERKADELRYALGRDLRYDVRDDWSVRCHPASKRTFIATRDEPEIRDEMDGFVERCVPGMTFIDVGAHFGAFCLAAARFGGPTAKIIAVDPNDSSNNILRANLRLAGCEAQVKVLTAAMGEERGSLSMLTTGEGGGDFMVAAFGRRPDAVQVRQETVDELVSDENIVPTHLKIDVEAFELEALTGSKNTLAKHRPVVFLELHCDMLRARGISPRGVLDLLESAGYSNFEWRGRKMTPEALVDEPIVRIVVD